jgi:hypothetical protein
VNSRKLDGGVKASTLPIFCLFDGCYEKGNDRLSSLKGQEFIG